jgi:hypothetical protein
LEILLAASIGVLLMGGLYVAMSVQLRNAQESRYAIEQGNLVRSIAARLATDISSNLGTAPQISAAAPPPSSASGNTSTAGGTATAPAQPPVASDSAVVFNLGVQGTSGQVILFVSRPVRSSAVTSSAADSELPPGMCDLRRITYWLVQGSSGSGGLARQEVHQITATDAMDALPPNLPNEESFIIAPEVKSLAFKYFDGAEWKEEWDGTAPGPDGTTPLGPPLAVGIEMSLAVPGSKAERMVRHVVAIQTANGPGQPTGTVSTGTP